MGKLEKCSICVRIFTASHAAPDFCGVPGVSNQGGGRLCGGSVPPGQAWRVPFTSGIYLNRKERAFSPVIANQCRNTGVAIRPPEAPYCFTRLTWPRGETDCHTSDIGHWFAMTNGDGAAAWGMLRQVGSLRQRGRRASCRAGCYSDQCFDKSSHCGFLLSINLFFRFRFQLLICFSRVIA